MNPLTHNLKFLKEKCSTVDYIDIKGTNCVNCTQTIFQRNNTMLCLRPNKSLIGKCNFDTSGGGKFFFLSGNLGRRLEIFSKICNVTITKITKQMHNYCIICTLVIIGFRQLLYARTSQ